MSNVTQRHRDVAHSILYGYQVGIHSAPGTQLEVAAEILATAFPDHSSALAERDKRIEELANTIRYTRQVFIKAGINMGLSATPDYADELVRQRDTMRTQLAEANAAMERMREAMW